MIDSVHRLYRPYGTALELFYCKDREVLLSGPAGTGKSRACLEKLHLCACKYPGMRALILRKVRESLTESALVTFEDKVLPEGSLISYGTQRKMRQAYRYPNGSEVVIGGLDKAQKIMSTEYDMIYVQEAIELTEDDWEKCTTRLRNGVIPYQQLLADTNPDTPNHWLKQRCDAGNTVLLESRHEDNPTLWDRVKKVWTESGVSYLSTLDALTGARYLRLRHGRWVQAEGVVYEGWDRRIHLIPRFEVPKSWPRYWVVDFGFTNPFVWQEWADDPDGRLYRVREIYRTQRLVEDHAKDILAVTLASPRPRKILCDHDAEDRATLERHLRMTTTPAKKAVSPGIQAVASRLRVTGDRKPRIFYLADSLVERDSSLSDRHEPCCTEEEFDGYVWDTSQGKKRGEEPVKRRDHGMDTSRYMVAEMDLGEQVYSPIVGGQRTGQAALQQRMRTGIANQLR